MTEKSKSENPLIAGFKKIPGLSILLPTKALLYDSTQVRESVLNSGEIHIHPMSVKDELILKSPDLLMSGEGFDMVISRCVPDILKPMELFQPDVDAILVGLRIATYGEELSIRIDNPYYDSKLKGSSREMDYIINLTPILSGSKFATSLKEFVVTLKNKQVVTMNPLRYKDSVKIILRDVEGLSEVEDEKGVEDTLKLFEATILAMIKEVDQVEDKSQIREWLDELPVALFTSITDKMAEMSELGPKLTTDITDPISKKTWNIALPVNPVDFFAFGPSKVTLSKFWNIPKD